MSLTNKYPISIQSFENIRTGGYIYVDKTDLVWNLAQMHVCFLCRPRRFGKSLLVSTLEAYFNGRKDLFSGLAIDSLENEWLEYPIFHVDFSNGDYLKKDSLNLKIEKYLGQWEREYGKDPLCVTIGDRFQSVIENAYTRTGRKVVVLIDEYDKPLLDALGDELETIHRNILKELYSTFKSVDNSLKFVLLTGVTKFSQASVFSGFNQPYDISMDPSFDAICGITENELGAFFHDSVETMADRYSVSYDEMKDMLKAQYDGYHFSESMLDIYNPFSLINAFQAKKISNYWFRSGTPAYLVKLLAGRNVKMDDMTREFYPSDYFIDYRADVEDPLAMLYQSGYLTIKDYDKTDDTYRLDFPNTEVRRGFTTFVANDYFGEPAKADAFVRNIGGQLRKGDVDALMEGFTAFLADIPYSANQKARAKNYEDHYQYTMYLIIKMLSGYVTLIEKQNSNGRADLIVETPDFVYIFEFKLDGSADEALSQIEAKGYAKPYMCDNRDIIQVGVNISSKTGTVCEWKSI